MVKVKTDCVMVRIVGYYRPTSQWNTGKKQELADRKMPSFKKKG